MVGICQLKYFLKVSPALTLPKIFSIRENVKRENVQAIETQQIFFSVFPLANDACAQKGYGL